MAREWKCARCSVTNPDTAIACKGCGMIRGAVVVPPPSAAPAPRPSAAPMPGATRGDLERPVEEPSSQQPVEEPSSRQPDAAPLWQSGTLAASTIRPRRLRVPIGLVLVIGFVVVSGAYNWFNNASRSDTGAIDHAGQLDVSDLQVGDCFDLHNPDAEQVDQVVARPCADRHGYELLFADAMPDGAYPTDDDIHAYVAQHCTQAFGGYVGLDYERSTLDLAWFFPTSGGWGQGDRMIQCAVYDPEQDQVTGSLRGAAR